MRTRPRRLPGSPARPRLGLVGACAFAAVLLVPPAFVTAEPAPDETPAPAVSVPPLQIGRDAPAHTQVGELLAQGTQRAYLSPKEEVRLHAYALGMVLEASQGPLAALPVLGVPVRLRWDPVDDNKGLPLLPADLSPKEAEKRRDLEQLLGEFLAFCDALNKAYMFKASQFAAAPHASVTWDDLKLRPRTHRGELVHVQGTLRRVYRHDPPVQVQLNGVRDMYEGWMFDENTKPWCVIFTELPEGVEPSEKLNVPVTFDGYFFKVYGYRNEAKQEVTAPLLIGNRPVLLGPVAAANPVLAAASEWSQVLLFGLLAVVVLVVALAVGLTWWFRRADAKVRGRLTEISNRRFVDPSTLGPDLGPDGDGTAAG